ncbi:4-hydroxy-tetrahydrodipicolinate reductase [Streptococcus hongkongensis]|nr:dihydrodipicolinate reductase [Streptococcus uberis]
MSIKVIIAGFNGKMGSTTLHMVKEDSDLEVVALFDPNCSDKEIDGIPVVNCKEDLEDCDADVWIDFTNPTVAFEHTYFAIANGFCPVIGTTGFTRQQLDELHKLSIVKNLGGLIAPNFAIGAILLMEFATKAAKYFSDLEIIELHHNQKKDAPSGTAIKTAEMISQVQSSHRYVNEEETELIAGARGADYNGIKIHSVRLPGLVAHQEVIFGGPGEGLSIRHDSFNRDSFMRGVNLAIKEVIKRDQLVYGLENLL